MSIDEAIAKYKEKSNFYKQTTNIAYGLELEQLAEWLEELKAYKAIGTIEELEALKEEVEPKKVIDKKYNLSTSTDLDKLLGQKPDYERYPGCGYDRSWCG